MDIDTAEKEQELRLRVLRRAKHVSRIPLLPESSGRILQMSRQPPEEVNVAELDRLITRSPTLASRLLSVSNSTYYSLQQKVTTVRQAIVTLGIRDSLSLVLVTSLMDKFDAAGKFRNLDPAEFRTHAVATGAAARAGTAFCRMSFLSPVEVNLAGLLHDIGRSIFIRFFPAEFDLCLDQVREKGGILRDRELEVFGIAHDELGGILAEEWKLPEFICQIIKHHHNLSAADEAYNDAIFLIAWSNCLLRSEGIGQALEPADGLRAALADDAAGNERISRLQKDLEAHRKDILTAVQREIDLASGPQIPQPEGLKSHSTAWAQSSVRRGEGGFFSRLMETLRNLFR